MNAEPKQVGLGCRESIGCGDTRTGGTILERSLFAAMNICTKSYENRSLKMRAKLQRHNLKLEIN
jgi:hypothetical protein